MGEQASVGAQHVPTETPDDQVWNPEAEEVLRSWRKRAAAAKDAHYVLGTRCRRNNVRLGIPAVVFSTVVGTSLFATLAETVSAGLRAVIGLVSMAAAVLTGLQTFLRFGERAEKHVTAADWYASVVRDIEQVLALPGRSRESPKDCLNRIRKEMNKIGQQSPEIGEPLWTRMARKHRVEQPPGEIRPRHGVGVETQRRGGGPPP